MEKAKLSHRFQGRLKSLNSVLLSVDVLFSRLFLHELLTPDQHQMSAQIFLLELKKFENKFVLTLKWLDSLLLMTSYLVTMVADHH